MADTDRVQVNIRVPRDLFDEIAAYESQFRKEVMPTATRNQVYLWLLSIGLQAGELDRRIRTGEKS